MSPTPADPQGTNDVGGEAQAAPEDPQQAAARAVEASLEYHDGAIDLANGVARVDLPVGMRYLDHASAERVLHAWGNPPGNEIGMIVPSGFALQNGSWAVVIEYVSDGHVSDSDAGEIDYDDLLRQMRDSIARENPERSHRGFDPVTLHGWAERPHYNSVRRAIYWAKDLSFGNDPVHQLNYDARVLGRDGVLQLSVVTTLAELTTARSVMRPLVDAVHFQPGHRYEDYREGHDRLASYGIATLVAGMYVAQKVGLWKGLVIALVAAKKLIVVGLAAIGAFVRKLFGLKKPATPPVSSAMATHDTANASTDQAPPPGPTG